MRTKTLVAWVIYFVLIIRKEATFQMLIKWPKLWIRHCCCPLNMGIINSWHYNNSNSFTTNSINNDNTAINHKLLPNSLQLLSYCMSMSSPRHPALGAAVVFTKKSAELCTRQFFSFGTIRASGTWNIFKVACPALKIRVADPDVPFFLSIHSY